MHCHHKLVKFANFSSFWVAGEGGSFGVERLKSSKESEGGRHVAVIIAGRMNNRAEDPALRGIIGAGADDRYPGAKRYLVESGLPSGRPVASPLGGNDENEVILEADLLDDLADQILRRAAVDRNPAERPHEATQRAAEQALLADEPRPVTLCMNRSDEHCKVPIAGVGSADDDELAGFRDGTVCSPAAALVPL